MIDNACHATLIFLPDRDVRSDAWEAECERLARQLAQSLLDERCTIRPERKEKDADPLGQSRSDVSMSFSSLMISAVNPSVLTSAVGGLWTVLSEWLKRRSGSRCVIRTPDGSEFQFENLTKDEALHLLRQFRIEVQDVASYLDTR